MGQSLVVKQERSGLVLGPGGLGRVSFPDIPPESTAMDGGELDSDDGGDAMCTVTDRRDTISTGVLNPFYYFSFEAIRVVTGEERGYRIEKGGERKKDYSN